LTLYEEEDEEDEDEEPQPIANNQAAFANGQEAGRANFPYKEHAAKSGATTGPASVRLRGWIKKLKRPEII